MSRGRFITFEGVDGTGKTTQIELLKEKLEAADKKVILLREPGTTAIGEAVRAILLDPANNNMAPEAELLLFEAARAQLVREVIEPTLAAGVWVISDRFMDSTEAYQGYGRGLDRAVIASLNRFAVGTVVPDLTILLTLGTEGLAARLARREAVGSRDRIDAENDDFRTTVDVGFQAIASREPERVKMFTTTGSKEKTADLIFDLVRRVLL